MECRNCGEKLDPHEGFLIVKKVENGMERDLDSAYCGFGCLQEYFDFQPGTAREDDPRCRERKQEVAVFDTYGEKKIDGKTCVKAGPVASMVLKELGYERVMEGTYSYFLIPEYRYVKFNLDRHGVSKLLAVETRRAEAVYEDVCQELKESDQGTFLSWIKLIG